MKYYLFSLWLIWGISVRVVNAQVTTSQLLNASTDSGQSQWAISYFNTLSTLDYRLPWVDKLELRTETERLLTSRQEFLFRTSFNSFAQKKFELRKHQSLVDKNVADFQKKQYERIGQRYLDILEVIRWQSEKNVFQLWRNHHQQLDSIYKIQLSAGENIDLADFLKNREEWLDAENKSAERSIFIKNKIGLLGFEGNDSLIIFNRVTVEAMYKEIQNLSPDLNSHPALMELGSESIYLDNELLAEKAKDKKILDFAQVRYSLRDDLLLQNQFSLGVGLTIPWRGSSKLRYQNIAIEQLETQFEKNRMTQEVLNQLAKKKSEFSALYSVYQMHINQQTDPEWVAVREKIVQSGRIAVTDLFELRRHDLDHKEKMEELYIGLLSLYIECLSLGGKLTLEGNFFEEE